MRSLHATESSQHFVTKVLIWLQMSSCRAKAIASINFIQTMASSRKYASDKQ
jgi:hypothetical protein